MVEQTDTPNIDYHSRIVDTELADKLSTFGATHIIGPKWCGKTTTAKQVAKSALLLQKDPNKAALIRTAEINPAPVAGLVLGLGATALLMRMRR